MDKITLGSSAILGIRLDLITAFHATLTLFCFSKRIDSSYDESVRDVLDTLETTLIEPSPQ